MVSDTRVSSEQTVKQQERTVRGVAQMVMNMEAESAELAAEAASVVSGRWRRGLHVC